NAIEVGWHSLIEDFDAVLDIVADIILNPTFPEDELERVRQQVITGLREQEQDTGAMASSALRELMYPVGHPYRTPPNGYIASFEQITRVELVDHHNAHFVPPATTFSLVGVVENLDEAVERIGRVLGDWTTDIPAPQDVAAIEPLPQTQRSAIT